MEKVLIKITLVNKILLSIFLLTSPVFAMEVDCEQVPKPYVKETLRKPALRRSDAECNLFAGFSSTPFMTETLSKPDSELFVKPLPITCAKVTFPAETEKLEEAIKQHTTLIEIHIPRAGSYLSQQKEVCPLNCDPTGALKIKQLCIKHSIGNERGYWRTALEALMPFIASA